MEHNVSFDAVDTDAGRVLHVTARSDAGPSALRQALTESQSDDEATAVVLDLAELGALGAGMAASIAEGLRDAAAAGLHTIVVAGEETRRDLVLANADQGVSVVDTWGAALALATGDPTARAD